MSQCSWVHVTLLNGRNNVKAASCSVKGHKHLYEIQFNFTTYLIFMSRTKSINKYVKTHSNDFVSRKRDILHFYQ